MKRFVGKITVEKICLSCVFSLFLLGSPSAYSQSTKVKLLGDFEEGWDKHWIERSLSQLPARYQIDLDSSKKPPPYKVEKNDNDMVLRVDSNESASVLWRMVPIHSFKSGTIQWRWKVERSLTDNKNERQKQGDDYAARIVVVFEPHLVSWKTRALHYVWAGREPAGSVFRNPYANNVAVIVVESANRKAGKWVSEERSLVADYERIFGDIPEMISAVAVMVDTDNTQSQATAWFDDISLQLWNAKVWTNETALKDQK